MSFILHFACGKTSTNIRVDAAVIHYLLEAPLETGNELLVGGRLVDGDRPALPQARELGLKACKNRFGEFQAPFLPPWLIGCSEVLLPQR